MRKVWIILLIGIMLSGCGMEDRSKDVVGEDRKSEGRGCELEPRLIEKEDLVFQYKVKNISERDVELEFTSSQRIDYSIKTKAGEEIFLYSSVTSFLQVLGKETIKPGEMLTYEIDLKELNLSQGEYLLTVWLAPKDGPAHKVEKEINVR
ncbi:BsuPI-related putative proteinase inhibitor [Niallia sp. Krafla_26]|uniref:BsuPI-related putative proteinase inhibitor n=1 Tax=Niallia sp. Krafla_26 TaxID=3064703 RepID=UPI003D18340D